MSAMRIKVFVAVIVSVIFFYCGQSYGLSIVVGNVRLNKKVTSLKAIRSKNVISQGLDYSCGPAALATILNYYLYDPVSEKEIITTLLKTVNLQKVIKRKGFSLLDLKRYAQSRGYNVTGYKMDLTFLKDLDKPVLVPIKVKNYKHFVVVREVVGNRVFIADPTFGNMTVKIYRFIRIWQDGVGLVIEHKPVEGKDPFENHLMYPLRAKKEDIAVSDYKNIKMMMNAWSIRTSVFPDEF
jgi:predicted double-glycine peptidase